MNYFIGIDGGGTKTKAVLVDENLNIISEGIGGPSNFLVFDINNVSDSILELLSNLTNNVNISNKDIKSILIGTAGAGRKDDAQRLEDLLLKKAEKNNFHINT